jgi:hypothetical protein
LSVPDGLRPTRDLAPEAQCRVIRFAMGDAAGHCTTRSASAQQPSPTVWLWTGTGCRIGRGFSISLIAGFAVLVGIVMAAAGRHVGRHRQRSWWSASLKAADAYTWSGFSATAMRDGIRKTYRPESPRRSLGQSLERPPRYVDPLVDRPRKGREFGPAVAVAGWSSPCARGVVRDLPAVFADAARDPPVAFAPALLDPQDDPDEIRIGCVPVLALRRMAESRRVERVKPSPTVDRGFSDPRRSIGTRAANGPSRSPATRAGSRGRPAPSGSHRHV